MSASSVKHIAKELKFKRKFDIVYGVVDGYEVSVCESGSSIETFIDVRVVELTPAETESLAAFFESNELNYGVTSHTFSKTGIRFVSENKKGAAENVIEFLYVVINQLKLYGAKGVGCCSNCGKPVSDPVIVKIGYHAHVCDEECAKKLVHTKRKASLRAKKHVFSGIFGGILGSVIGLAPWLALNYFGYLSAPAAFLVPLGASLGYRAFGGKSCAAKAVAMVLLSIAFFAAGAFAFLCYKVAADWWNAGYIVTLREVVEQTFVSVTGDTELLIQYLKEHILAAGAFVLLGLVFVLPQAAKSSVKYTAILEPASGSDDDENERSVPSAEKKAGTSDDKLTDAAAAPPTASPTEPEQEKTEE